MWRDKPYDFKSDIWSLGVIIYEVTQLVVPFKAESIDDLYKKVCRGVYPPISQQYSNDLAGLIKSMIQIDPAKRPTCNDLLSTACVRYKMKELGFIREGEPQLLLNRPFRASTVHQLLTPFNIDLLKSRLPEPKYQSLNQSTLSQRPSDRSKSPLQ